MVVSWYTLVARTLKIRRVDNMGDSLGYGSIMQALVAISERGWTTKIEDFKFTLEHKQFGSFTFGNVFEAGEFLQRNFVVVGHHLMYDEAGIYK